MSKRLRDDVELEEGEVLERVSGMITKNEIVRKRVLQTPKCPYCNYYVLCHCTGDRNEFIWPMCSNVGCPLGNFADIYIKPKKEEEEK